MKKEIELKEIGDSYYFELDGKAYFCSRVR